MRSIQSKILLLVVSGLLIMTVSLTIISLYTTNKILHKDADIILNSVCQKEAAQINDVLGSIEDSVDIMATYALAEIDGVQTLADDAARHACTTRIRDTFYNVAVNTDQAASFYLRYNVELAPPTSGFFACSADNGGGFVDFTPTDISKYSSDDMEHVGWYYVPIEEGEPTWLAPYDNHNNGITMVSYVVPIYKEGALLGVVGMDIDYDDLRTRIEQITVYENGYAYLVSEDGKVIFDASSDIEEPPAYAKAWFTEASAELDNGMRLYISANYDDIQRDRYPMMWKLVLASIAVFMVFIVFTVVMTRKIVEPLKKLTVAAETLASGNADVELDCDSEDEIGVLSRVFKKTSERLSSYMGYINSLAYRDSLTGLKNRTAYDEAVAEMDKRINCSNPEFAVLAADINGLKRINDTYGHDIGNHLIIRAASMLSQMFPQSSVYRIGGDEFVVILEGAECREYRKLVERLDKAMESVFITADGEDIPVTIARGVAVYNRGIDKVFEDVYNNADHLMYLHKRSMKEERE